MPVPKREVIPVRPRGGRVIHTTEVGSRLLGRTHCGRRCAGWVVADFAAGGSRRCESCSAARRPA